MRVKLTQMAATMMAGLKAGAQMVTAVPARVKALVVGGAATALAATAETQAQIVSWDGTDITFNIGDATNQILDAVAPIVAGGFIIIIFVIGVRYIYRQVRRV